jgi:hypothetical protein
MPIEQLTYAQIAERLGITADAARAIVQRHRLPRARANDSNKMLVTIDLTDIQHRPRGIEGLRSLELGATALLQASRTELVQDKLVAGLETVQMLLQVAQSPPPEPDVRPMITRSGERLTRGFRTALQSVRAMF